MSENSINNETRLELADKSLKDVAKRLLGTAIKQTEVQPVSTAPVPDPVTLTDSFKKDLKTALTTFNSVVPEKKRTLDKGEVAAITQEYLAINSVIKALGTRKDNIKEYIRNHLDEEVDGGDDELDSQGHKLRAAPKNPVKIQPEGQEGHWSNEYRDGAVSLTPEHLLDLFEAGEIDRKTYLAVTREVRVPDEKKLRDYVLKTGDVTLLAKLATQGRPVQALNFRGKKK